MQEIVEDGSIFQCGHCSGLLGNVTEMIHQELLKEHECLKGYENVFLNYENKKVYTSNTSQAIVGERPGTLPEGNENIWTDKMVKLLVETYKEHKSKFLSASYTKKKVWQLISDDLAKHAVLKNDTKCYEKWRNLKKTYYKVHAESNKSGNKKVSWKHFDDFQEIYWHDPYFDPMATGSSTGAYTKRKTDENISQTEKKQTISNKKDLSPGEPNRESISAAELDRRRQRRHEEKMNLKKEMFQWFKEHYNKEKE